MKVTGIIAEYNPFHNGHLYQLREAIRLTECDYTVIVMSGNFVQRGAPAFADKRVRAKAALQCGASLVLELPVLYATASAEAFAAGAVALLDRLGVVTQLCFGSECGDENALGRIADFLSQEPAPYRSALRESLRQGFSYPAARARALAESARGTLPEDCKDILSSPNNILGIEYIRALSRRSSPIRPVTVRRTGADYHDTGLPEHCPLSGENPSLSGDAPSLSAEVRPLSGGNAGSGEPFSNGFSGMAACSALALRQAMYQGKTPAELSPHMPPESLRLLEEYLRAHRFLRSDDFSSILYYKLIAEKETGYEKYLDVSPDLSDRIRKHLHAYTGFEAFCDLLKTKNTTYTRISRCLLHILLGIEKKDLEAGARMEHAPYARILGFCRKAAPLLGAIGQCSQIPLVTSIADARKSLSPEADRLLQMDILAGELYRNLARADTGRPGLNEISTPPVFL